MNKTVLKITVAAAAMLASNAFAQGYAGIAAGRSHINGDCSETITCDLDGTGFKVFGGYRLSPTWAAEVNYFRFGKSTVTAKSPSGVVSATIKGSAIGAGLVGSGGATPNWSGLIRFGIAQVKADVAGSLGNLSTADGDTSAQAYIGLGASYLFAKNLSLDLAADFSRAKWGTAGSDVRLISLGLTYGF